MLLPMRQYRKKKEATGCLQTSCLFSFSDRATLHLGNASRFRGGTADSRKRKAFSRWYSGAEETQSVFEVVQRELRKRKAFSSWYCG